MSAWYPQILAYVSLARKHFDISMYRIWVGGDLKLNELS